MKNLFNFTLTAFALAVVVTLGSCSSDDSVGTAVEFTPDTTVYGEGTSILEAYAKDVVISRYETLADCSEALYTAVNAIVDDGTQATKIADAADAWIDARLAWERTEAYLFGPVDNYSIDPGIDSWPLALSALADFIEAQPSASEIKNDNGEMKGFHTIEFLLFDNGAAKSSLTDFNLSGLSGDLGTDVNDDAASLTKYDDDLEAVGFDKTKAFLVSITCELWRNTARLVAEWSEDGVNDTRVVTANATLKALDYEVLTNGGGDYYSNFVSAGIDEDSSFSATKDALSVILESAAGIASEVGELKIGDPYASKNVLDVESWFSWNSVIDFTDNIVGIKEAYYGTLFNGVSVKVEDDVVTLSSTLSDMAVAENSISKYVASGSAALDTEVKSAIETAITAVSSLEYPFRNNLSSSKIDTAMDACAALDLALKKAQMAVNEGFYISDDDYYADEE